MTFWNTASFFKLKFIYNTCPQLLASPFYFQCDNHEIRPGKYLGVCISVANNRLFVGSIPKNKTRESILEDFGKVTGQFQMHGGGFVYKIQYKRSPTMNEVGMNTGATGG